MSLVPYRVTAIKKTDPTGNNVLPFASVSIIKSGGGFAQLWDDEAGTVARSNPFTVDANGERQIWLNGGGYNVSVAGGQSWDIKLTGGSDILSIDNVAALSSIVAVAGRLYELTEGAAGTGIGGGSLIGREGAITPDNINTFAAANPGFYFERTSYNSRANRDQIDYWRKPKDLSGLIQTNGKNVVITGDSLSYNNYGFGFPFAATAQDANAGIRSWGFLLRDAIHMSDPCFTYGDNIPWHIKNPSYAAVAINNTNPFVLPFNNRSLRCVVSNSAAEVTLTVQSFNIVNKQVILHLAHSPGQPGKFDVYYNDNNGGADVFVQNVEIGNGVAHQGYAPFTVVIPINTVDSCARIIFKNFTDVSNNPIVTPLAFYVLAAASKLTNVYTTGVGGTTSEYTNTNYTALIGSYDPDLLILCTGANDRVSYGIDRHIAALDSIITKARTTNPAVRIIHITAPPAVGVDNPGFYPDTATAFGSTMQQWVSAVERLCASRDVEFFNQYRYLYNVESSYLFVDGIHLTRNAGRDIFKALIADYFPSCGAPVEQLNGYSTYSVAGTGDLMGRQIGYIETTKAMPRLRGQFKITYVHGSPAWTFSENHESGTFKPSAFKSITIDGSAHTNIIEFFVPVVSTGYNEYPFPLNASVEYISGSGALITGLSIKPRSGNTLVFTIRDSTGALIDPSTINDAQFLIKYFQ